MTFWPLTATLKRSFNTFDYFQFIENNQKSENISVFSRLRMGRAFARARNLYFWHAYARPFPELIPNNNDFCKEILIG